MIHEILPYAVDYEMQKLMLLMEEKGNGQVSYLLFGVLCGGNEVDGLKMSEIDIPSENVDVQ